MAGPIRPVAGHPVFHDVELDAHRRFGVVDEAERMRDVVATRLSIGVRHFIETLTVHVRRRRVRNQRAAPARLHQPGARRAASRSVRIARPRAPSLNDGLEPDRTRPAAIRHGTCVSCAVPGG
ncbi:hypothetical protein [Burkholderia ubonensis]|uniref:hypothetical protein n=1 Tax=Burkholderia ubonensis TaxID=101571 RepID=UPI000ADB71CA|nr:hypothetical protein [Burkholderia ubonensis]